MVEDTEFILHKARSYCALQERCIGEMEDKLREWKVKPDKAEKIIELLIKEDYLNEERFAKSFAGGKFRINHWGKTKIIYELERRKVPDLIIQIGLEEIEEDEYEETLKELLIRKNREIKEKDLYKKKHKLIEFGYQKGYHYELIRRVLGEMQI